MKVELRHLLNIKMPHVYRTLPAVNEKKKLVEVVHISAWGPGQLYRGRSQLGNG